MTYSRVVVFPLLALAAASFHASAQSVVSTHSGVVYFFEGTVFVGDQKLEQKFGKFPDVGEGREIRTEAGRAEVLLTPGVLLRVGDNSAVRMLSDKLSDTRVELLRGSAIVESKDATADTSTTVIYKGWSVKVPLNAVYRMDTNPPQVRVYRGDIEVSTGGSTETTKVNDGEALPLAAVLVPEHSNTSESDDFKNWAMRRSEAVSSDNAIAEGIVDDPTQAEVDIPGLPPGGGFSYFPLTGIPSLGITNPYGLSFWSPYQPGLSAAYFPSFMYAMYPGWPSGIHFYPRQVVLPSRIGGIGVPGTIGYRPGIVTYPRSTIGTPRPGMVAPRPGVVVPRTVAPHTVAPHVSAGHR